MKAAGEMSGLEYLRAIARGELPAAPIANLLGFGFFEIEEGRVVFECMPAEYHYNPIGLVHGGLACTLADSAMGCAVHTMLPAGVGYTTLEIETNLRRRKSPALPVLWELPPEQRSARGFTRKARRTRSRRFY